MSEPNTLLLTETGVESLPDGSTAVNVGPIVRALKFLTEGRGDDRGTDETGRPLPDLMSLAFDVVESIILGGRKADYFRQVKRDLEAQSEGAFRRSLSLAKEARRVHAPSQATALDHALDTLQALLAELAGLSLDERAAQDLKQALEAFRSFGADRWVSASAQLLVALNTLGALPRPQPAAPPVPPKKKRRKTKATGQVRVKVIDEPAPETRVRKKARSKRAPSKRVPSKPVPAKASGRAKAPRKTASKPKAKSR